MRCGNFYAEAWKQFSADFDRAFAKATLDEMVQFAESHYEMGLEMGLADLLKLNEERSAARFKR